MNKPYIYHDRTPYVAEYETHFCVARVPESMAQADHLCIDRISGAVSWRNDDEETSHVRSLCFADRRQAEVVVRAMTLAYDEAKSERERTYP